MTNRHNDVFQNKICAKEPGRNNFWVPANESNAEFTNLDNSFGIFCTTLP